MNWGNINRKKTPLTAYISKYERSIDKWIVIKEASIYTAIETTLKKIHEGSGDMGEYTQIASVL